MAAHGTTLSGGGYRVIVITREDHEQHCYPIAANSLHAQVPTCTCRFIYTYSQFPRFTYTHAQYDGQGPSPSTCCVQVTLWLHGARRSHRYQEESLGMLRQASELLQ